ncbi:MAG: hypothetical protein ACK496_00930, partial [Acidobacteriota bacterium]
MRVGWNDIEMIEQNDRSFRYITRQARPDVPAPGRRLENAVLDPLARKYLSQKPGGAKHHSG